MIGGIKGIPGFSNIEHVFGLWGLLGISGLKYEQVGDGPCITSIIPIIPNITPI